MKKYILALDQGTTNSRAIIFDQQGCIVATSKRKIRQIYPKPGEVEHDPQEIWESQIIAAKEALAKVGLIASDIASIGISNQRETTILWDRVSGNALYNAIVWQCRRTTDVCTFIKENGWDVEINKKTGLVVDPYFSGTKIKWILDNVEMARDKALRGKICFGTVDTWLIWNLTGGKVHITDVTNASRTLLFDITKLKWDEDLLDLFRVPQDILPEVRLSSEIYGETSPEIFGSEIPIAGNAGDQQASLFGQACFAPGMTKNTYGTGSFMLMNTGSNVTRSRYGLLTTIAVGIDGTVEYALEGSVFITGAAIQWLRDQLNLINDVAESEVHAQRVKDTGGIYVVPAFSGLGAPYWDPKARGLIIGITRGITKDHIIRATLESIAYQVKDVLECIELDYYIRLLVLRVVGGAAQNDFLLQFQADVLNIPIVRPSITETTALGAAFLAGLAVDYWRNRNELEEKWKVEKRFNPNMTETKRNSLITGWRQAVKRSRNWES